MAAADKLESLDVWVNARTLVKRVYEATATGPAKTDFGYCNQLRRAAVSMMSNIAEGFGRSTDAEFARFLDIARGSGLETQSLLCVGSDVTYLDEQTFQEIFTASDRVIAQITSLTRYLRDSPRR